jgi:hypothetical protein
MFRTEARRVVEDDEFAAAARRFIKALGRRAGGNISTLRFLASMSDLVDELVTQAVHDLRGEPVGASWSEIGEVLGITRQAAQQRFGGTGVRTVGGQKGELR